MNSRSVLIVGLGQIGMGYDLGLPPQNVLSHARAFQNCPGFRVIGGVDPDPKKRATFDKVYLAQSYESLEIAMLEKDPDVVVVANPTRNHGDTLRDVMGFGKPSAILCEKPLSYDMSEARSVVRACEDSNIRLFVNYVRRSDPAVKKIQSFLHSGAIIGPFSGVARYTKGFIHNGTHMIDLLNSWFGAPIDVDLLKTHDATDISPCDAVLDAELRFDYGRVQLQFEGVQKHLFELELNFSNGVLRYQDSGNKVTWSGENLDGSDSAQSPNAEVSLEPSMGRYQLNVANDLRRALEYEPHNLCSGRDSLLSLAIANQLVEKSKLR